MSKFALRGLLSGVSFAALSCSAFAADMPTKAQPVVPAPQYSWTGWYFGGHAGIGWQDPETWASFQRFTGGTTPHPLQSAKNPSFAFGGFQLGYNYQMGQWVAGLETDISVRNGHDSQLAEGPIAEKISQPARWFGTVRGRLGWLWQPNIMLYGTGGFAYIQDKWTANITGPGPVGVFNFSHNDWRSGWVAGGGAEMLLDAHWSAKLEYQYLALKSDSTTFIQFNPGGKGNSGVFNINGTRDDHTVRMGLNYRFWSM